MHEKHHRNFLGLGWVENFVDIKDEPKRVQNFLVVVIKKTWYYTYMMVKIDEQFLSWFKETNPHVYKKGVKRLEIKRELTEYVGDVLQEHMESMQHLLDAEEDDSPDTGFMNGE